MQRLVSTQKQATHTKQCETGIQLVSTILSISTLAVATPAYAGLTAGTNMLNQVATWLSGLALGIATVVIIWNGYKVMTKQAQFTDLASVFIGAVFIASAGAIALVILTP